MHHYKYINLTQHDPTRTQEEEGVGHLPRHYKSVIKEKLTFDNPPSRKEMRKRAKDIVELAKKEKQMFKVNKAMIGGAPYFMGMLAWRLRLSGITPYYSFSVRRSNEYKDENGDIKKEVTFRHEAWIKATWF